MSKTTLPLGLLLAVTTAFAGEPAKTVIEVEDKSWCEKFWEYPILYKNKDTFLQQFQLIGRFHGDVYTIDSNEGYDQDWVVRRLRIGAIAKLRGGWQLKVEVQFDPQSGGQWYSGLTETSITYTPREEFSFKVGKIPMTWTNDGWISSNNLQTLERNNLSNNLWFTQKYFTGASFSGKAENWVYYLAVASTDVNEEFGDFDASAFGVASIGYDFSKALGAKKALLRADYVYNDFEAQAVNTRPFDNIGSIHFEYGTEKWGFSADVTGALGVLNQGDVWGAMVMPWYNITDKFQVVGRYTHLNSNEPNSIRFNRYENTITSARGDQYDEYYLGLNYYICGNQLKLQTGLSYAQMDDAQPDGGAYKGWQWVSGVRFSF